MRKTVVICCLIAAVIATHAQGPQFKWIVDFGSKDAVRSTKILIDHNGNIYTLGTFTGTQDFDLGAGMYELTSNGTTDIFLMKTDADGNFLWAKSWGGVQYDNGVSIVEEIFGNIYISGIFQETIDIDPGTNIDNRTAASHQDMFICKLNFSGDFIWAVTIPGLPADNANFIGTDDMGNVYMNGNFEGSVDFNPGPGSANLTAQLSDIFILKLDASGDFQWVKQISSPLFDYVNDIAVDHAGNIYTTGGFQNTVDFDPGAGVHSLTSNGSRDAYILKLDANGNFQWVLQVGSSGLDEGGQIEVDDLGNVYTAGGFNGTVDFDPGPATLNLTSDGGNKGYIMKLNAAGDLIWATKVGGPLSAITDLRVSKTGGVYITGTFVGAIDFDPAKTTDDLNADNDDTFIAKFDNNGAFQWSGQIGGAGIDVGYGIATDEFDNVFITGVFNGTADFDPGAGVHELSTAAFWNSYILKVGVCAFATSSSITETTCKSFTLNDKTYTSSGTYTQTVPNAVGCDSTITLHLTITGNIATEIAKSICEGESFEGYTMAGTYTDSYLSANGCDSIRTLTLTIVNKPSPKLGDDVLLCKGDSIVLYPGEFDSYTWQDGSRNDRLVVTEAGVYAVMVETACGVASDQIIVKAGPCGVFFPGAFTPNNDGVNDVFKTPARNNFFSSYRLTIYNRWGQKIFESSDPEKGWDGKVNGTLLSAETYVWNCNFTVRDSGIKDSRSGTVILLR